MRFSKSRSGLPNAFFVSSSDIIVYTPACLQVLWGTLKQFKPKRIEEKFSKIKSNDNLDKIKKDILSQKGFKFKGRYNRSIKLKGTSKTPTFFLAFQGIKVGPRESYVLDILSSILGDGESSYLSKKYVSNKKPVLSNVYAANYTMQESGVFFIGGQLIRSANKKWIRNDLFKKNEIILFV